MTASITVNTLPAMLKSLGGCERRFSLTVIVHRRRVLLALLHSRGRTKGRVGPHPLLLPDCLACRTTFVTFALLQRAPPHNYWGTIGTQV